MYVIYYVCLEKMFFVPKYICQCYLLADKFQVREYIKFCAIAYANNNIHR